MGDDGPGGRDDRPYVVEAQRARPTGPSRIQRLAIGIAAIAIAALSGWGLLLAPGPAPVRPAVPADSPGAPTPEPAGPTLALPRADGEGLPSVRAGTDAEAFATLAVAGGWPQCPMWRPLSDGSLLEASSVEAALGDVPRPAGMITVQDRDGVDRRVWVGGTEDDAARGFGGSSVVHVGEETWTSEPAGGAWDAVRVDPLRLPTLALDAWVAHVTAVPAAYCGTSFGGPPPAVVEVPGDADPYARFVAEAGWYVCRKWQRFDDAPAPTTADVDLAAEEAGIGDGAGWLRVAFHTGAADLELPIWVGDDPAEAGLRHGSRLVVLNGAAPRTAWMAVGIDGGGPMAVAFDIVATPQGRTAWLPTGSAAGVVGSCQPVPAAGDAPPSPSLGPAPGDDTVPVELLRGVPNASALLAERLGWIDCRMATLEPYPLQVPPELIDTAADEVGIESGMLQLTVPGVTQPVPVFLGADIVELARTVQVPVVAVDGRPVVWLADETIAREWLSLPTPAGRTAWVATGAAAWPDGGCEPPRDAAPGIAGLRSITCWTDRDRCLEAIEQARAFEPGAFGPAVDVAAGLGPACPALTRCPWTGPNQPVLVTVAPADWSATGDLRVFTTGLRRLSTVSGELPLADVGPETLALASRPAIALPVGRPADACEGPGVQGSLDGNPWDPRVAWIDGRGVRWPAGSIALFTPMLRLYAPDGSFVGGPGDELLVQTAAGGAGDGTMAFDACSVVSPPTAAP
jgi:hypothetical protein